MQRKYKRPTLLSILLLLLIAAKPAFAQKRTQDSLRRILSTQLPDTTRVNVLIKLSKATCYEGKAEEALKYGKQAIALAEKTNYAKGKAAAEAEVGYAYANLSEYAEAEKHFLAALKIAEDTKDLYIKAYAIDCIGGLHIRQGAYKKGLEKCSAAIEIRKKIGDKGGLANSYNNLGTIYDGLGDYPKALKNYMQALQYYRETGDELGTAHTYSNIGIIYDYLDSNELALRYYNSSLEIENAIDDKLGASSTLHNIGIIYGKQGNYEAALKNYTSALAIRKEIGDKEGIGHSYNSIGSLYHGQGKLEQALANYSSALAIKKEINDQRGMVVTYNNMGLLKTAMKQFEAARNCFDTALNISKQIDCKDCIRDTYIGLIELDSMTGNWKAAYKDQEMYVLYRDSIINQESLLNISQLQKQAEADQQKLIDLANDKDQRQLLYKFLIGFLAVLLIVVVIVNRFRNRIKEMTTNRQDAPQMVIRKMSIVIISIGTCVAGLIWAWLYYHYIGWVPPTYGPIIYCLAVAPALLIFFLFKKEQLLVNVQVTCIFVVPVLMEWLGGGLRSGVVINWALLAPVGALMYKGIRQAAWWMGAFMLAIIITIVFNKYFSGFYYPISDTGQSLFYGMNIIGPAIVIYFSMQYFVRSVIRDGVMLQESNDALTNTLGELQIEKQRSDALLLNILPEQVAEELRSGKESEAKLYNNVTVILTDFKNFTNYSEQHTPHEIVSELHHCFKAFDAITSAYGIEKIKTIGDGYLAVCGLPEETDDHAVRVVKAAQEIIAFMDHRYSEIGDKTFRVRVGIHSGQVVAGIVGNKKFAYDIWGDTVNVTARMEQNSEAGKINISGATHELVKTQFNCRHRGKIPAKNVGEIDMYFVE